MAARADRWPEARMGEGAAGLLGEAGDWLIDPGRFRPSTLILLAILGIALAAGVLYRLGVIGALLGAVSFLTRVTIGTGFRTWEVALAWASWPLFLGIELLLLAAGVLASSSVPQLSAVLALGPMGMGLAAVLAYMFIDVERYDVARGFKALADPLKGQSLAGDLAKYGHQAGVPLMASAAVGMIGGFALFNDALYTRLVPIR